MLANVLAQGSRSTMTTLGEPPRIQLFQPLDSRASCGVDGALARWGLLSIMLLPVYSYSGNLHFCLHPRCSVPTKRCAGTVLSHVVTFPVHFAK